MFTQNPDSYICWPRSEHWVTFAVFAYTSPNRALIKKLDASIRNFKHLVRNMRAPFVSAYDLGRNQTMSPSVGSASTSPERIVNNLNAVLRSPSLSSTSTSPKIVLVENKRSPLLSSTSSSSGEIF
ncbi:hypothetical protein V6N13_139863 [Hibiscus sabdariffa]|uniref:Uncharacterized protein n=2 Tax=Hibiscus sabdariffa TaxID=183260 RepID=A0ABR2QC99_9ROSI